ncbi:MAG: hypothetical protein GY906_02305, partial [bacterium]|nr:hypothetical protein [bacterium]
MNRKTTSLLVSVATGLIMLATPVEAELADVWVVSDGTKVKRDATSHPLAVGNTIFNRGIPGVSLFAARNETVAFQVILEGGSIATDNVRVRLDNVGPIDNSGTGPSMDSYFVGRHIELFLEHYLNITTRSHDMAWSPGTPAQPDMSGWVPDALIVLAADDTFSVASSQNQGVWVDIYIPKTTAPGWYSGTIVVEVDGSPCTLPTCQLPVTIEVLDASLPDEPTAKTMLYFSSPVGDANQWLSRYVDDPWDPDPTVRESLTMRHYKLGRRHR